MAIYEVDVVSQYLSRNPCHSIFFVGNLNTTEPEAVTAVEDMLALWDATVAVRQCIEWRVIGVNLRNVSVGGQPAAPLDMGELPPVVGDQAGGAPLPFQSQLYVHFTSINPAPNKAGKHFPYLTEGDNVGGVPNQLATDAGDAFGVGLITIGREPVNPNPNRRFCTVEWGDSPRRVISANPLDYYRTMKHQWGSQRRRRD